jgi:hypothetical protein
MNTLLAGRTLAQEIVQDIRQFFRAAASRIAQPDATTDEASTRFSWPRGM